MTRKPQDTGAEQEPWNLLAEISTGQGTEVRPQIHRPL